MSEQNSSSLSISFRVDDGVIEHNNREIIAKNVDPARISDNITYTQIELKQFYEQIFGEALAEYNARQTRSDRRINDYYEHIKKSGKGKLFYEVVVQFGDLHDCGVGSEKWETAKQMLDEYMREFEQCNPNLKVFNAVMHLDESTPHLHIDFVPVAHKGQRGLSIKNSMSGALREQGFSSSNRMQNEWTAWSESERSMMEQILRKHGLSRDNKDVHRGHLSVDEYKKAAQQHQQIKEINAHINELKKKPDTEFTAEDAVSLNNQNDYMRGKVTELQAEVEELSKKVNAKFVPVYIYKPDKLEYMADGLDRAKIQFVAESNTIYIPDYALKTAQEILRHYKPSENLLSIREQIALDIDRLVYTSTSFEELLDKLKERGYEIKQGKYVSVKHPNTERFVRLKTLGEEYLPKNLAIRIAERNLFTNKVSEKAQAANAIEKRLHITIFNITTAVKQFRLEPKKSDKKQYYYFQNDERINYLSVQLATISEFGLTSREDIYAKASELQRNIYEIRKEGCNPAPEEAKLQRINELIKAYEEIVEGNYIDNLIKAQNKQKQEHTQKHSR